MNGDPDLEECIRELDITDERYDRGWLDDGEVMTLARHPMSPDEAVLLHMELCMGLRRVEVARLNRTDVDLEKRTVTVRRHGDSRLVKARVIPFVDDPAHALFDTETVVRDYLRYRESLIDGIKELFPGAVAPREFMVFRRGFYVLPYAEQGKSTGYRLNKVARATGVNTSNPTLRRTFAHNLLAHGATVDEVAMVMGIYSHHGHIRRIGRVRSTDRVMSLLCYGGGRDAPRGGAPYGADSGVWH